MKTRLISRTKKLINSLTLHTLLANRKDGLIWIKHEKARFNMDGSTWHGVQYGELSQICHCKRLVA